MNKILSELSVLKQKFKTHKFIIPDSIKFIVFIYILALGYFTVFRVVLLLTEFDKIGSDNGSMWLLFPAFFMGWRFDTVICSYILAVPALLCFAGEIYRKRDLYKIAGWISVGFFLFTFLIGVADIPFFNYNFSRFTTSAFLWIDSPLMMFGIIFQNMVYVVYAGMFLLAAFSFVYFYNRFVISIILKRKHKRSQYKKVNIMVFYPLFLLLIFIGIRGRIAEKSPIRTGTAFFSNNSFINQLGLNPVFTFFRSLADDLKPEFDDIELMSPKQALKQAAKELSATVISGKKLKRVVNVSVKEERPNVVLILMESMSAIYLKKGGAQKSYAPFLDSLAENSIYFSSFYSSGLHTFNGVYSSLYSLPTLFRQHPLKSLKIKPANGLPQTLRTYGYHNYFFMTHDDQFDNMGGYLRNNGFDQVISKNNYPSEFIVNTLGVPDDKLYEQVISKLGEDLQSSQFFCTILTVSNHPPYYTPEYFQSNFTDEKERGAAFADWSLKTFFRQAEQERWYKNTVFLILGDHGTNKADKYELPLAFCHIPLIIFQPGKDSVAYEVKSPGGQIDIYPTVMGILNQPYENMGLGIDLLNDRREYIYINGDDKVGVITDSLYYIFKPKGEDQVFDLHLADGNNLINSNRINADLIKHKVFSLLQTTQQLIK